MKHAKRKFLFQVNKKDIPSDAPVIEMKPVIGKSTREILRKYKDSIVILQTDDQLIKGYIQSCDGEDYIFPIPDLTLIYFSQAQRSYQISKGFRSKMLSKLDLTKESPTPPIHEMYDYFGAIFSVVTNLFTALESFINQLIPNDYEYLAQRSKCTEVYDYDQILKSIDFKTKVKDIIPEITNKYFFRKTTPTNQLIWNLKNFRDELIHLKPEKDPFVFSKIYKRTLTFKYPNHIEAVAKYINHHEDGYVEECDCGEDW